MELRLPLPPEAGIQRGSGIAHTVSQQTFLDRVACILVLVQGDGNRWQCAAPLASTAHTPREKQIAAGKAQARTQGSHLLPAAFLVQESLEFGLSILGHTNYCSVKTPGMSADLSNHPKVVCSTWSETGVLSHCSC